MIRGAGGESCFGYCGSGGEKDSPGNEGEVVGFLLKFFFATKNQGSVFSMVSPSCFVLALEGGKSFGEILQLIELFSDFSSGHLWF